MPHPLGPTTATVSPGRTLRLTPSSVGVPGTYAKQTLRNSIPSRTPATRGPSAFAAIVGSRRNSSKMRVAAASPVWSLV